MELNWTTNNPTEAGAYWVRGYNFRHRDEAALVEVRRIGNCLCSNLHATNSDNDSDNFDSLASHNDRFEWCGPLVPANA